VFDFNDQNSLSMGDIQFLVLCCVKAVYKIFHISAALLEDELFKLVVDELRTTPRVNYSQMVKWVGESGYVRQFLLMLDDSYALEFQSTHNEEDYVDGTHLDPIYLGLKKEALFESCGELTLTA
jgi:hypothetical protein